MNIKIPATFLVAAAVLAFPASSHAMSIVSYGKLQSVSQPANADSFQLASARKFGRMQIRKSSNQHNQSASGAKIVKPGGGGTRDTCNSSDPFYGGNCAPEKLAERCEGAWGMSSEPGGGVSCEPAE